MLAFMTISATDTMAEWIRSRWNSQGFSDPACRAPLPWAVPVPFGWGTLLVSTHNGISQPHLLR